MSTYIYSKSHVNVLVEAFKKDNFDVTGEGIFNYKGYVGITAVHKTATIGGNPNNKKKAFYVEGSPEAMGYLIGYMAEEAVSKMANEFVHNIIDSALSDLIKWEWLRDILEDILLRLITWQSERISGEIPDDYHKELEGMLAGCKASNNDTKVTEISQLWRANVGIDAILGFLYTGKLPALFISDLESKDYVKDLEFNSLEELIEKHIKPTNFKIPALCNAFANSGKNSETNEDYHYFGRDFMFSTADVFQDVACMIIQKPEDGNPFVSMTAPGMIGSIAGLNFYGLGVGVDMVPSANANHDDPGFNSLLLTRWSIQQGQNFEDAVDEMVEAERGIPWLYVLADGQSDTAGIVESGMKTDNLDFLSYPAESMKSDLPDSAYLKANPSPNVELRKGLMVRENGFEYPACYNDNFNKTLFERFEKKYDHDEFSTMGYIDQTWTDTNCPTSFYFAPQRENNKNLVIVSNMYIIPEMRLCGMSEWIALILSSRFDDLQWRYDELNNELLTLLEKGYITYDEAKNTINFLSPDGKFPDYYNKDHQPLETLAIQGCVSIMDLKKVTIDSHYGYYDDEWVTITLPNYFPPTED